MIKFRKEKSQIRQFKKSISPEISCFLAFYLHEISQKKINKTFLNPSTLNLLGDTRRPPKICLPPTTVGF